MKHNEKNGFIKITENVTKNFTLPLKSYIAKAFLLLSALTKVVANDVNIISLQNSVHKNKIPNIPESTNFFIYLPKHIINCDCHRKQSNHKSGQ